MAPGPRRHRRQHRRRASTAVPTSTVDQAAATLFAGTPAEQPVWMSHGDACSAAPEGFTVTASTDVAPGRRLRGRRARLYGVQYHPEVMHSTYGQQVLEHFLYRGAGCRPTWTTATSSRSRSRPIREQVGNKRAICGLSGGVDSAVAAALVQKAIGDQLTCVYVDHGLMRKGETEQVEKDFVAATGVQLKVVDAARALPRRAGRASPTPRQKRKIIGREFIRVFEQAAARDRRRGGPRTARRRVPGPGHALPGRRRVRRRHRRRQHQVAPQRRRPARRPGVRAGRAAAQAVQGRGPHGRAGARACRTRSSSASRSRARGWASASSARSPRERLDLLREADAIAREELTARRPGPRHLAVPGGAARGRPLGRACRATAVPTVTRSCCARSPREDAMTADWSRLPYDVLARISTRITNEVPEVNRVVAGHHQQAARHHRVGVTPPCTEAEARVRIAPGPHVWRAPDERVTSACRGHATRSVWTVCVRRLPLGRLPFDRGRSDAAGVSAASASRVAAAAWITAAIRSASWICSRGTPALRSTCSCESRHCRSR